MNEMPMMASSSYVATTTSADQFLQNMAALNQLGQQNHFGHAGIIPVQPAPRAPQVFIADSDENVPLADSLLYSGEQKLTDLTDQELFFEIDIKSILDMHNAKRTKMVDKSVKERVDHLEPVRIRDLKMTVVTVLIRLTPNGARC